MSRVSRIKSSTGLYHVMLRGVDKRIIFTDDMDRIVFLKRIERVKRISDFKLYAYCLMDNHVHMLIGEGNEPLEVVFKRIGVSYVSYFNSKHQLCGHLYQDRFRSEPIETQSYFIDVLKYICQNPVKAGLCSDPSEYCWLGCCGFREESGLIDDPKDIVSLNELSMKEWIEKDCTDVHIDNITKARYTDRDAINILCSACKCTYIQEIGGWDKERRNRAIADGLSAGLSARQISRVTGIGRGIVDRVKLGL